MKLFLVVLLAGVWSTAVTAAPSPNGFKFQEYGLDFAENFATLVQHIECVKKVVTEAVVESEFTSIWNDTKTKIDQVLSVEWPKCQSLGSCIEKAKCKLVVIEHLEVVVDEFVKKLSAASAWELVNEIKEKVSSQCFHSKTDLFEIEEFQAASLGAQFLARFECVANALQSISQGHDLQSLWEKSQPGIAHHLAKWKLCANTSNTVYHYICEAREGVTTFVFFTEYIALAASHEPKFIESFATEYKQTCAGKSNVDELFETFAVEGVEACVQKLVEKMKCISAAISEAVDGTSFQNVWEEAQHNLEHLLNDLNACTSLPTTSESAKCITKQLKGSYSVFVKVLSNLKEANKDVYNNVTENIKKKCYA